MKKSLIAATATGLLMLGALPGWAGTTEEPEITDPAGDANFLSAVSGNTEDTRPVSFDNADLQGVWFETSYTTSKQTDPATGQITNVRYLPDALLVHIRTVAPVRPTSPWGSFRFKVQATVPSCQASLELLVATAPANDAAEIRPAAPGTTCGDGLTIVRSEVKPTYEGAVSTMTFPLWEPLTAQVLSVGTVLSQPSALVTASLGVGSSIPESLDEAGDGSDFTVGQDVPPDVDCTADPGNPDCQP